MKDESKSTTKKASAGQRIFGAQLISEGDASLLVGGIVEKGFTQPSTGGGGPPPPPRPSVLPFPVARHRSHGPHWSATNSINMTGDTDDDGDEGEEENFAGIERFGAFAKPVRRKEKKGLNYSHWREVMAGGESGDNRLPGTKGENINFTGSNAQRRVSDTTENANGLSACFSADSELNLHQGRRDDDSTAMEVTAEDGGDGEMVKQQSQDVTAMMVDAEVGCPNGNLPAVYRTQLEEAARNSIVEARESAIMEVEQGPMEGGIEMMQADTESQYMSSAHMTSSFSPLNLMGQQVATSTESDIDAENHERLGRMSANEIAEAQAEIVEKLSPSLVEALRKRGLSKLQKKSHSAYGTNTNHEMEDLHDKENLVTAAAPSITHNVQGMDQNSDEALVGLDDNVNNKSSLKKGSLWDAWSRRVEAVRDLRFSLDGKIVESDDITIVERTGVTAHNGYNADNVSQRDFLRTEGDPGAAGYTIKEAVALTRSVVPGQRTLALNLIAALLERATHAICQNRIGCTFKYDNDVSTDSEAIWAYTLGPEPELALSLRMSLDDNNNSVVLACARVILCVMSCDPNEKFFDILEKLPSNWEDICTAPVFRSRPQIDAGFLQGGFWKYNTKPSNILPYYDQDPDDDKSEGEQTIQDDIVVAGQDIAAGLVRMGILERIRYLLETDPSVALEEYLISMLIGIARHSPTCAAAIMKCERLVQTVANRFTLREQIEINSCKIKSVTLFRVLGRCKKNYCIEFIKSGIFHKVTWHLYRCEFSLQEWINSGREACKYSSALLIEQLRFWKVCIQYGCCISFFSDLFPALCPWICIPKFENLIEKHILNDFAAVTREVYNVLKVLSGRLPNFYLHLHQRTEDTSEDTESWCWSHVGPIVNLALDWTKIKSIPYISSYFDFSRDSSWNTVGQDSTVNYIVWTIASVMNFLSSVLEAVVPKDPMKLDGGHVPWLPEFVPKIGLEIVKNGFLTFSGINITGYNSGSSSTEFGSFLSYLCHLRYKCAEEMQISATSCLQSIVQVILSVDKLIHLARPEICSTLSKHQTFSGEQKILADGLLESSMVQLEVLQTDFMRLTASEWQHVQSIQIFGRGGPAPGIGIGWGASGGGIWSLNVLSAQQDARLLVLLLENLPIVSAKDPVPAENLSCVMYRINSALGACLVAGPRDMSLIDKILDHLFQVPILACLDYGIREFLHLNKGFKPFSWEFKEEEYLLSSKVLASHFRERWLLKKKPKPVDKNKNKIANRISKKVSSLQTIHEEKDELNATVEEPTSLVLEWARQRLPLPTHWFLSPLSTINSNQSACVFGASNISDVKDSTEFIEAAKGGLFLLLGVEAMSHFLGPELHSCAESVPVIWKLHALSTILLSGMSVIEEKSRDVYETLQDLYGRKIDKSRLEELGHKSSHDLLQFESEIDERYSTFIEALVEQFSAISYGDLAFGRQVALYLHQCVETPVRLAAWNALSNARVLDLLPPLEKCIAEADGYLEPAEEDERILDAYAKSWVSGAVDRAASRRSVAFSLVLHHLSSFIFKGCDGDKLSLRNKLVKSLLRDYSHKQQHEGMMIKLVLYKKPENCSSPGVDEPLPWDSCEKRFQILRDACEGSSSLKSVVENLESCTKEKHYGS